MAEYTFGEQLVQLRDLAENLEISDDDVDGYARNLLIASAGELDSVARIIGHYRPNLADKWTAQIRSWLPEHDEDLS